MPVYLLVIDQGTTSTRAMVYNSGGQCVGMASQELKQHYPKPGWVEHDAEEIWNSVAATVPLAIESSKIAVKDILAIGLTNQRETVVLWDAKTGKPVARAIVWQDRRTTRFCRERVGDESWVYDRTGLVIDPYFSASKIRWLLDENPSLRQRCEAGEILAGTIDSWLIRRLTGGQLHATDVTNASRTCLLNIRTGEWDEELCGYFAVPRRMLPEVRPSAGDFGVTRGVGFLADGLPIAGVAGDQQSALFGQRGFSAGDAKCTYGTGAFFLQHTGSELKFSQSRLLASIAATRGGKLEYVLEGSVFIAGAAVQWLRDGLKLFDRAPLVEQLAEQSDPEQPILFIPGFVGLGAPHWVPEFRGTILGITRETTAADLGRAALEGVAYQIADLVEAAGKDTDQPLRSLRVDGGMARNAWFLQCQADILGLPVLQSIDSEATALGAAYLAGLQMGVWSDTESLRALPREVTSFDPLWDKEKRLRSRTRWGKAVRAVMGYYAEDSSS